VWAKKTSWGTDPLTGEARALGLPRGKRAAWALTGKQGKEEGGRDYRKGGPGLLRKARTGILSCKNRKNRGGEMKLKRSERVMKVRETNGPKQTHHPHPLFRKRSQNLCPRL